MYIHFEDIRGEWWWKKKKYISFCPIQVQLFLNWLNYIQKNAIIYVSISFDSQLLEVYSFGRKKVGNPFSGGFVREDMKRGLFKDADCVIYSLTVTERQLKKLKRYIFAMERSKEIYRYHFWFVRVSCK